MVRTYPLDKIYYLLILESPPQSLRAPQKIGAEAQVFKRSKTSRVRGSTSWQRKRRRWNRESRRASRRQHQRQACRPNRGPDLRGGQYRDFKDGLAAKEGPDGEGRILHVLGWRHKG